MHVNPLGVQVVSVKIAKIFLSQVLLEYKSAISMSRFFVKYYKTGNLTGLWLSFQFEKKNGKKV